MYKVQSVIFDKKKFSLHLSKEWLKKHGYKDKGVDDKDNFYRFRQFNPASLKKQGYVEFRTKKLGKSGAEIIIAYKNIKDGGRISNDDLHHFIHSSYRSGASYKDWNIDPSLSDASVQVYFNGKDAVVVHRGSQDAQDWKENALTALGIKHGLSRLEHSRKIQKEAESKYGANNVITIGHSKGAQHAEEVGQNSREIYTLNKPVTPYDLLYKKVPEKQTDIKTTFDPVSILRPLQQGNEYQNIISKTLNPLTEHLGSVLGRINPNKWWGKGLKGAGSGALVALKSTEQLLKMLKQEMKKNELDYLTILRIIDTLDEREKTTEEINEMRKIYNNEMRTGNLPEEIKNAFKSAFLKTGGRCWKGYEPVPGRKPYSKGSCRKVKTGGALRSKSDWIKEVDAFVEILERGARFGRGEISILNESIDELDDYIGEHPDEIGMVELRSFIKLLELIIEKVKDNQLIDKAENLVREYSFINGGALSGGKPCYNNDAVVQPDEIPTRNPRTRRWREVYREAVRLNVEIRTRPDHQGNLTHINRFLAMVTELTNNFTGIGEKREISHLLLDAVGNPHLNVGGEGNEIEQRIYHLYTIVHQIPEGAGISGRGRELGLSYY
jgi:hypothetical protein